MVSLKRLEERAQDLLEEYRSIRIERLSLVRRSFDAYSSVSWRVQLEGSKRRFVSLADESAAELLESIGDLEREQVRILDSEVQLLNANLKIEWTKYQEHCRLSHPPEDTLITPKQMPGIIDTLS
ncbi:hypothetical protein [Marinobacterium lutimaris]|uniref:Uncharacterized protein n=1 Tax=Marinobacterium lutimaris TaxID=568106 RepID=A0A1H6DWC5_9GAMM|nr:hypothetical protein [Marinobacterium lutimaris]SEG89558.1 hypothetical protein SAMN05444390_1139 [Marinobacterium lutimaris]